MATLTKQQLAQQHEQLTGQRTNMRELGYTAGGVDLTGMPARYRQRHPVWVDTGQLAFHGCFVLHRTRQKRWRVEVENHSLGPIRGANGGQFYKRYKVITPVFPNPIAAALWLRVEVSNGSICLSTGEGSAGTE